MENCSVDAARPPVRDVIRIGPTRRTCPGRISFRRYRGCGQFWFWTCFGETASSYEAISSSVMPLTHIVSMERLVLVSSGLDDQCIGCEGNLGSDGAAEIGPTATYRVSAVEDIQITMVASRTDYSNRSLPFDPRMKSIHSIYVVLSN